MLLCGKRSMIPLGEYFIKSPPPPCPCEVLYKWTMTDFSASCHLLPSFFLRSIEPSTSDLRVFYKWYLTELHTLPVKHNGNEKGCYILRGRWDIIIIIIIIIKKTQAIHCSSLVRSRVVNTGVCFPNGMISGPQYYASSSCVQLSITTLGSTSLCYLWKTLTSFSSDFPNLMFSLVPFKHSSASFIFPWSPWVLF